MRRLAVTALILVAAAATAATAGGAVPVIAKSKATVRIKSCSLEDKTAVFYARMRKLRGTRRMRMKFALLERASGTHRYKRIHAPGLVRWRKSAEGVRAYGYSQEVRGLQGGATYRMRVRYRWYDKDNDLQRSVRRTSRPCRMFVPLPNLRLRLIDTSLQGGGIWRYRARVTNGGQVQADEVGVQLSVDLSPTVYMRTISRLEPGESTAVAIDAPRCKQRYSFRVDPDGTVSEGDESDNLASASC